MENPSKGKLDSLFEYRQVKRKKLVLSLTITLIVMVLEIIGGIYTNSIALLSDAGHMFTHAFAIGIGLFAIYLARQPVCHHKTYGLYRAEILAAFINGLFLLVIVAFIIYEAILRILNPLPIDSIYMFLVAVIGLAVNLASIGILHGSHRTDINVKGVFYHMIGDAASSIGIVIVSVVIFFTGWSFLDPIVSFVIAGVVIYWALGVLKESSRILLEMAPEGLDIHQIEEYLKKQFDEILDITDSHLWTISTNILVFSTHIRLRTGINQDDFIERLNEVLFGKFDIFESTIQITFREEIKSCKLVNS
ncbi:MAG: cation transporter [Promethearchaeota archaeon]|nr:MAG: cation transporter [Candidatus Lokiarchaeota archaeon]